MNLPVNQIVLGECEKVLPTFADNSIDTIITDPPYGIGFMGKEWDTFKPENVEQEKKRDRLSHRRRKSRNKPHSDQPSAAMAAARYDRSLKANTEFQRWFTVWGIEALRILKPGGTMLIFGGTRTYHRLTCGIEDAGFIIKDCIMWLYGSGFPKATDISKQLDKTGGKATGWFGKWLKEWRAKNNITQKEIAKLFPSKTGGLTGCVANWELGLNMPTAEQFTLICKAFGLPFDSIEEAEREVIGKQKNAMSGWNTDGSTKFVDRNITKPATEAAELWDGWKSHGLKPAYEPILVAMKPNDGTYAENALKWGVSGLNIEAGRIEYVSDYDQKHQEDIARGQDNAENGRFFGGKGKSKASTNTPTGRYPANVILDETAGRMLDEQSGDLQKAKGQYIRKHGDNQFLGVMGDGRVDSETGINDSGGASRFFYCAKASKSERNEGCEGLEEKQTTGGGGMNNTEDDVCGKYGSIKAAGRNHHPTVKPLDLMEYLCRITSTPTGGLVLDPFAGSGTTCIAAYRTGRDYIGIEKEAEYCEIARKRIVAEKDKLALFER